jgi:hypothetical protein
MHPLQMSRSFSHGLATSVGRSPATRPESVTDYEGLQTVASYVVAASMSRFSARRCAARHRSTFLLHLPPPRPDSDPSFVTAIAGQREVFEPARLPAAPGESTVEARSLRWVFCFRPPQTRVTPGAARPLKARSLSRITSPAKWSRVIAPSPSRARPRF